MKPATAAALAALALCSLPVHADVIGKRLVGTEGKNEILIMNELDLANCGKDSFKAKYIEPSGNTEAACWQKIGDRIHIRIPVHFAEWTYAGDSFEWNIPEQPKKKAAKK